MTINHAEYRCEDCEDTDAPLYHAPRSTRWDVQIVHACEHLIRDWHPTTAAGYLAAEPAGPPPPPRTPYDPYNPHNPREQAPGDTRRLWHVTIIDRGQPPHPGGVLLYQYVIEQGATDEQVLGLWRQFCTEAAANETAAAEWRSIEEEWQRVADAADDPDDYPDDYPDPWLTTEQARATGLIDPEEAAP